MPKKSAETLGFKGITGIILHIILHYLVQGVLYAWDIDAHSRKGYGQVVLVPTPPHLRPERTLGPINVTICKYEQLYI